MPKADSTRNRSSTLFLLIALLSLILVSVFLSRDSLLQLRQASVSTYNDRLVPTAIIVQLTATLNNQRQSLEDYVFSEQKQPMNLLTWQIDHNKRRADSLLTKFSKTLMTKEETIELQAFRRQLTDYNQLTDEALTVAATNPGRAGQLLLTPANRNAFGQMNRTLDQLTTLQLTVGDELLTESNDQTNYIFVLTALQIGMIFLLGIAVLRGRL